jgi:membrane-bound lytic murein transglycosylase D
VRHRAATAALVLCAAVALGLPRALRAEETPSPSPAASPSPSGPSPSPSPYFGRRSPPAASGDPPLKGHEAEPIYDLEIPAERPDVARKLAEYSSPGGRAWIEAVMRRSAPYRDYIVERIRSSGLPRELLYLPVVESEYKPSAVSRSGAAGMWQFMRNSIGGYGMRIDEWRDDRRDFMKSTEAALKKLEYNRAVLGDWYLAIGAYNCGLSAMQKAVKKGGTDDFWALSDGGFLPPETRAYLPKFLAIAAIASYSGRYGLAAEWPVPLRWELLALEKPVDIGILAEKAGLPAELLRSGNPELRYNVTPPGGSGWMLKLPAEAVGAVKEVLADPSLKLIKYYLYTVRSGDTLSALARHYGIGVDMILSNNPGVKPASLRIGAVIVIPAMKDVSPYEGAKPVDAGKPFAGSYKVVKGDTLWSIALRYSVAPETLAERNGMSLSSILREGSVLKVPIIE